MSKKIVLTAAIALGTAIMLGALAAHGLEKILPADLIDSFQKGVTYQFYAGFALLITGLSAEKFSFPLTWFYRLNLFGLFLFSGGIYLYCFHLYAPVLHSVVHLVPVGGVSFIAAWLVFAIQLVRR